MLGLYFILTLASAYMKLDLTVLKGNTPVDSSVDRQIQHKRDENGISIENLNMFYLANISLGSTNQTLGVLLDTGSSDLWVPERDCNNYWESSWKRSENTKISTRKLGQPHKDDKAPNVKLHFHEKEYYDLFDCLSFGYFSPNELSTFQENTTAPDFEISYLDGSEATGYWGSDYVTFGDYRVNMTFGVALYSDLQPVLGIGLVENEVSNYGTSANDYEDTFTYLNFPLRLKEEGLVKSHAYSILLGRNNASEGELLFGAVDHGKYDGQLQRVKIVNEYEEAGYKEPFAFDIILDGISSDDYEFREQTSVLLDTGSTLLRLPYAYFYELYDYLDLRASQESSSLYEIDCNYLNLDQTLSFYFSGIEIQVPLRDLVYQYYGCYFGIRGSLYSHILGANILKNAYVVYDLDNEEIAMAQAAADERPETIEEISSTVPLALKAPYYSKTKLAEYYVTDRYGYLDETSQAVESALYDFATANRTSYDLGLTTYVKYYTYSQSVYGDTYTTTRTRYVATTTTTTTTANGAGKSALGGIMRKWLVLLLLWI